MQFCFLHHFMAEGSAKMKRQSGIKLHDVRVQRRAASPHNATSTATAQYYLEQKCNTTYNNSARQLRTKVQHYLEQQCNSLHGKIELIELHEARVLCRAVSTCHPVTTVTHNPVSERPHFDGIGKWVLKNFEASQCKVI